MLTPVLAGDGRSWLRKGSFPEESRQQAQSVLKHMNNSAVARRAIGTAATAEFPA